MNVTDGLAASDMIVGLILLALGGMCVVADPRPSQELKFWTGMCGVLFVALTLSMIWSTVRS